MDGVEITFPGPVIGPSRTLSHFVDQHAFDGFAAAYSAASGQLPDGQALTVATSYGLVRAYRFAGQADPDRSPIVLLSGRDSATPMWAPALPDLLALGRPVWSLDSIGGPGCSSQSTAIGPAHEQAAWVAEAIHGLGLDRVHLVGHSLGGWLAVQVALHRSEVVASVTALDPPRVLTELNLGFVTAGITASLSAIPTRWRRRLIEWIASAPMVDGDPIDDLGWTSLQTFRSRIRPPHLPDPADLAAIGVPVLVILAGASRVHNSTKAARAAAQLPPFEVEVWARAGHCLHAEQPARLATRLGTFADRAGL